MTGASQDQGFRVLKEKVEILNGDRGDKRKAAMREGDAQDLREFIAQLRAGTADVQKLLKEANANLDQLGTDLNATQAELTTTAAGLAQAQDTLTAIDASLVAAQAAIDALGETGESVAGAVVGIKTGSAGVTIPALVSAHATAAPTQAEFNLLVDDVAAMRTSLVALRDAIAT